MTDLVRRNVAGTLVRTKVMGKPRVKECQRMPAIRVPVPTSLDIQQGLQKQKWKEKEE